MTYADPTIYTKADERRERAERAVEEHEFPPIEICEEIDPAEWDGLIAMALRDQFTNSEIGRELTRLVQRTVAHMRDKYAKQIIRGKA